MNNDKHTINFSAVYDVLGYSLVGMLSYIFGLFLLDYNAGNHLILESVKCLSSLGKLIITAILFQIALILSFGKIYAVSILKVNTKAVSYKLFHICNCCLLFILPCVLLWLQHNYSKSFIMFLINIIILCGIYSLNYLVYKIKLNKAKNSSLKKTSRYVLVCPAILMIGVNIYYGASVYDFIQGDISCVVIGIIFLLFFAFMYLFNPRKLFPYILFTFILIAVGIMALPINDKHRYISYISLPAKNAFLAIMVSIFLSIFESWYISFRQMRNAKSKSYIKVTSYLIIAMPPIVFLLFPIQDFKLIYLITFCLGMIYTDIKWFFDILPFISSDSKLSEKEYNKKKKNVAVSRATCGILTLIFLILDKYFPVGTPQWAESHSIFSSENILSGISIVISLTPLLWDLWKSPKNIFKQNFKNSPEMLKEHLKILFDNKIIGFIFFRHIMYAFIPFVGHKIHGYMMADTAKAYFSIDIMWLFMAAELIIMFLKNNLQKGNK